MKYIQILYGACIALLTFTVVFLYWKKTKEPFQNQNMGKIYVFYHVYCNENTESIVRDQIGKIIFSPLYDLVDSIKCGLTGDEAEIQRIKEIILQYGSKFQILAEGPGDTTYERFTLHKIRDIIKADDKFLYIHSKGVTNKKSLIAKTIDTFIKDDKKDSVYWWRTYMEYFLFKESPACIKDLDNFDIVGLPMSTFSIGPHFSGNFWWSTGKYYLSLAPTIGVGYHDPESYIFTGNPKHKVLDEKRFPVDGKDINLYVNTVYSKDYLS